MQYFFVLGNHPTLSIAELLAVFGLQKLQENKDAKCPVGHLVSSNIFILETNQKIQPEILIKKLGGTIKIGIIDSEIKDYKNIKKEAIKIIDKKEKQGKFKFGISCCGTNKFNPQPLGMEIKKYLKKQDINCRWVTSKLKTLSSVVVEQNKLISKGLEIILIQSSNQILLGHTLAVQPFKELSFRDYGRPNRDDRSGMLPPKLAQIMINLAGIPVQTHYDASILDPFCGSGTILTEAMLMGYNNLIGSDISKKAIQNTEKNINWIISKFKIQNSKFKIFNYNASLISQGLKPNSIDAIVTEPYLGPQRGKININKVIPELEQLYSKALKEFKKILKPNSKVVMIWPTFVKTSAGKPIFTNPRLSDFKIINSIPKQFINHPVIKLTNRNTIIYGRKNQKVWREIVVLTKK